MSKKIRLIIIIGGSVLGAAVLGAAAYFYFFVFRKPAPPPPPPPVPLTVNIMEPSSTDEPLLFYFNQAMFEGSPLSVELPSISLTPEIEGSFTWRSPSVLAFSPASGQWLGGSALEATVSSATPLAGEEYALGQPVTKSMTLPYFEAASKMADWEAREGFPRLISQLKFPGLENAVGARPIFLLYDQPVDPAAMKSGISVERTSTGKRIPFELSNPSDLEEIFGVYIPGDNVLAVEMQTRLDDGEELVLTFTTFVDDSETPVEVAMQFRVNQEFVLLESGFEESEAAEGRRPLDTLWFASFNNPFDLDAMLGGIDVEPDPVELGSSMQDYQTIALRMRLSPGVSYKITLPPDQTDYLGNKLSRTEPIRFTAQDLPPTFEAPNGPIVVEKKPVSIPVRYRNAASVDIDTYIFPDAMSYITALHSESRSYTGYGDVVSSKNVKLPAAPLNEDAAGQIELDATGGFRLVELTAQGRGSESNDTPDPVRVLVNATTIGLTAKVSEGKVFGWATRLADAEPIKGASLALYDGLGFEFGTAVTDARGIGTIECEGWAFSTGVSATLYLLASLGTESTITVLKDDELSAAWQFNLAGVVEGAQQLSASVFTDRGAYRPGESVNVKVLVGGASAAEQKDPITLVCRDPRGKTLLEEELTPDAFGGVSQAVALAKDAAVGKYVLQAARGTAAAASSFRVEEYRVPTFLVKVDPGTEAWRGGDTAAATITAAYYQGGALGGRPMYWRVFREPAPLVSARLPGFIFQKSADPDAFGTYMQDRGSLDGTGRAVVSFVPTGVTSTARARYVVEATVTDVDRQSYAGQASRIVDAAELYVGYLAPSSAIVRAGAKLRLPLAVVDTSGTPVKGRRIEISWEQTEYHSAARLSEGGVQMSSSEQTASSGSTSVVSADAPVAWEFTPPSAGVFRLIFSVVDDKRTRYSNEVSVTASGGEGVAWPRFDIERVEVVRDKESYSVGDTARLVAKTPYAKATCLLTVERDGIIEASVVRITNNTPEIPVAIKESFAPNAYASLAIVRGRIHYQKDATGFETGAPGFKIGYTELMVESAALKLAVKVQGVKTSYKPGSTVNVPVTLADSKGRPVAGQLTVMVVDEAVLALTGYRTPDPIPDIYFRKPLGVRTASSLLDLPHSRRERLENLFPGGGGGEDEIASRSDLEQALRKLFKSTAYWNPNLKTNAKGSASFSFKVPDNVTTYRIMVVAADGKGHFGSTEKKFASDIPLAVQPVLPRFVYPGDELSVGALVFNKSGDDGDITVEARLSGLAPADQGSSQTAPVDDASNRRFDFKAKAAQGQKEAVVRFTALMGSLSDSAEYRIPILSPGNRRAFVESAIVRGSGSVTVDIPEKRIPGTVSLEVAISTSALSELKDSIQYLMDYPHGCIEQTTSTAYPLVVLADLLPAIGVEVNKADLKKFSEAGVKRILTFQTPQGGLSYWPGESEPHAFGTAFGLTVLIEAKKRGYDVPDSVLDGIADFMRSKLAEGTITKGMAHGSAPDGDTRALYVASLGRLGRPQPQYIQTLWKEKDNLTPFGLAFLAIAVKELPSGDKALLQSILDEIRSAAQITDTEVSFGEGYDGGWSFGSPIRTQGAVLAAFAVASSDTVFTQKLLEGLLSRKSRGGFWGNTQENVFGIMGIYELAGKGSITVPGAGLKLTVAGKTVDSGNMESPDKRLKRISYSESELGVKPGAMKLECSLSGATAPTFLTVRLQYEALMDREEMAAVSQGFTIERSYETTEGRSLEGKTIPLGSLVRVRIRVKNPELRNYIALTEKLPAGLEPMNTNLATTGSVDQGTLGDAAQRGLSVLSYSEMHDSWVGFYANELPSGEYEFLYVARATTPGVFLRAPARVEVMYETEKYGLTLMDTVTIK